MIKLLDLVAIALLVGGCATVPIPRPYATRSAQTILETLNARDATVKSLRADTKVQYVGGTFERVKVSTSFFAERPNKLRVEAEAPMGGALATLTSDGARFSLLDARDNRFLTGAAAACNIARLLQVELSPDDIVAVLLGGAPLVGKLRDVSWDLKHGYEVLQLDRPDGSQLFVRAMPYGDNTHYDIAGVEHRAPNGKVLIRVTHQSFEASGDGEPRLPKRTTIVDVAHHKSLDIRYRSSEPNVAGSANAFVLNAPGGLAVEEVGCK